MSEFSRETLLNIIETDHVQCGEASALARMALVALDNEPVAWTWHYREQWHVTNDERRAEFVAKDGDVDVLPLYRHAQPAKGLELAGWQFKSVNGDWLGLIDEHGKNQAVRDGYEVREVFAMADGVNDRDQVRREHAEWSQATFGNVGPVGPLKHLSKEALEAAEQPGDLSEWADMQFLLWDAQRRAGITDEQITQAMIEKLAVNKQRKWPEPKDGEPRMHIKEQPAPVVGYVPLGDSPYDIPYSMPSNLRELIAEEIGILFSDDDAQSVWNVCRRAAMLAAAPQEVKGD